MTAKQSGKLLEIIAESRAVCYFPQRFLQLVSKFSPIARHLTMSSILCDLSHNCIARQVALKITQCNIALSYNGAHYDLE